MGEQSLTKLRINPQNFKIESLCEIEPLQVLLVSMKEKYKVPENGESKFGNADERLKMHIILGLETKSMRKKILCGSDVRDLLFDDF